MDQELYRRIVSAYRQTGSVDRTAEICGTYAIKVRKVLITEGLWRSKKSDAVNALREKGYSVPEIAETLGMEEKNVQFYLPYAAHAFASGESGSRGRVQDFRERGRKAEEGSLFREDLNAAGRENLEWEGTASPVREREGGARPKGKVWAGYQLRIELVRNEYASSEEDAGDLFRDVQDAAALRRLLKTKNGITREVIVPGWMSLHQLSYAIQELFGLMNCHLHHFSLPKVLFRQLTDGKAAKWAEMCGVYFHVPVTEDYSDLYWDDDYRQGKSVKAWTRSKYTGKRENYAVGETYLDSMRLLKEEMDWIREVPAEEGDNRELQDLSLEEYNREYAMEGDANTLLERLKAEEIFRMKDLLPSETEAWRDALREDIGRSLSCLEAFRKTKSFRSLEEGMKELRRLREDRDRLHTAIWRKREEVKNYYGRNPELVLEETETEIRRMERQIGEAMHVFDPPSRPVAGTLYYHYDYGDDWLFRIICTEIHSRPEERFPEKENAAAFRKIRKELGSRYPETEKKLKDCRWGKNFLEEDTFVDSRGREEHNMLFLPLRTAFLEEKPVCIAAEGLSLVEDVGGPDGFFSFIRTLHGEDTGEAASLREWARGLGWKETVPKADRLL